MNVKEAGATVPSLMFELVRPIVTLSVGIESKETWNVAANPASFVIRPLVGVTVIPAGTATSLSLLVTTTSAMLRPE